MKFAYLTYFHLLWLLLALLIFYIYTFKNNRRLLARWSDLKLVVSKVNLAKRRFKVAILLCSILFIIITLCQPQWGYHWEELKRKGIDIVIALDTSKSMLADDIKPNRLEFAKLEITDLLKVLEGDRIGLVAFAGTSFLQCPLTLDYGAFRLFLDNIDTDIIPQPGTDIGGAIRKALGAFPKESKKHRAIILITDGEDHSGVLETATNEAKKEAVPIYVVGIGSSEGTPIPVGDKTYLKDKKGNIVLSRLGDVALKKVALATGGAYVDVGSVALDKIYTERISKLEKKELESARRKIYENRFQWPLTVALILLVLEGVISEKNKINLCALRVLCVLCVFNLGFGKITEGNKLYEKGNYDEALKKYTDAQIDRPESPELYYNIANILYKQRKYSEAEAMLEKAIPQSDTQLEAKIYYNIGNSKYRQGQLRESLDYYKKTLELNPDDEDAKYNIEFVEKKIKEMLSQSKERQEKQESQRTQRKKGEDTEEKTEQETQAVEEMAKGETQPAEDKESRSEAETPTKVGELTKEEAEKLLQMMQDEEKEDGKPADKERRRPSYYPEVEKPW